MHVVEFTKRQTKLLDRFRQYGGCVDYVLLNCEPGEDVGSEGLHREAAVAGLEEIQRRWGHHAQVTVKDRGYSLDQVSRIQIDYDKARQIQGVRISPELFLGNCYDFERKGLLLRGSKSPFLNQHFFYLDDESEGTVAPLRNIERPAERDDESIGSYSHAFSDPPYPLFDKRNNRRCSRQEVGELFESVNKEVLGSIEADTIVFEWSRGWSNYFDAGEEWWGAFLWTLANPGRQRIAMIGASSTD